MTDSDIKLVSQFSRLVYEAEIEYFAPHEILFRGASNSGGSCAGKNMLPPSQLHANLIEVAKVWDMVRASLGKPIRVLSGYRAQAYNSCIGGAPQSLHMVGSAMDCALYGGGDATELRDMALELRSEGVFKGGVGYYQSSNFVHIDCRGSSVTWNQ